MDCDICFENFDYSEKKPLLLLKCAHTMCLECVTSLVEKKCPSCSSVIEDTQTNWSILKLVIEAKFDGGKVLFPKI